MTAAEFIALLKNNPLTERAGAQAHFDDLCDLLEVEKPRDPENCFFERGAKKAGGGDGWADVWKRGFFGRENKKPGRDLKLALKQLTDYALQLENSPLLVVSDRERIIIHTAFTGYPDEPREILIDELADPEKRQIGIGMDRQGKDLEKWEQWVNRHADTIDPLLAMNFKTMDRNHTWIFCPGNTSRPLSAAVRTPEYY